MLRTETLVDARSTSEVDLATTLRRRSKVFDLPITLDRAQGSVALQVGAALRTAIVDGLLRPGLKLPSSRELAGQLRIRRNAIVSAYEYLASDGLIESRHGAGTFVADQLPLPTAAAKLSGINVPTPQRKPFALGYTHVDSSLLRHLGALTRKRIATATADDLGYGDPRGSLRLRAQVSRHLAANRGVRCDPNCVMIVSGTQQAVHLCSNALLRPGAQVWMEDPGYYATQTTLRALGVQLVPVGVDAEGLCVSSGVKTGSRAKAAYVTPSHQFPTGVSMSMQRRIALLNWAREADAWVIEDDYDSEFRYAGPPLTALVGLANDRVIYIGTFTKTLFASLRLAYLVLPPSIVEAFVAARAAHDRFPPLFLQDAVADLIEDGTLAALIRRNRKRYRDARDVVVGALSEVARASLLFGCPDQGLHLLAKLPPGHDRDAAPQIRSAAGIDCRLLSEMRLTRRGSDGFILGFSGHDTDQLITAARRLGAQARLHLSR
jgi:GntR family transcriptional regulator/MocR family aminotransferase